MFGEEFRRRALLCRLPRNRLRPILAELERRRVFRVWPGAPGTVETVGLVASKQRLNVVENALLAPKRDSDRLERVPAARGSFERADARHFPTFIHWHSPLGEIIDRSRRVGICAARARYSGRPAFSIPAVSQSSMSLRQNPEAKRRKDER